MPRSLLVFVASCLSLAACTGNQQGVSIPPDAGHDAGLGDAGVPDAGHRDGGHELLPDDGGFQLIPGPSLSFASSPTLLAAGDFNGDRHPDVLLLFGAAFSGEHQMQLFLGNGDGTLNGSGALIDTLYTPRGLVLADFNRDGNLDAAIGICDDNGTNAGVLLFFGDGKGGFAPPQELPTTVCPFSLAAADIDGDGLVDLVTTGPGPFLASATSGELRVYLGTPGDGGLTSAWSSLLPSPGLGVTASDLRNRGLPDLIVARVDGVQVLQNESGFSEAEDDQEVLDFPAFPPLDLSGGAYRIVKAADLDGDGRPDLVMASVATSNIAVLKNLSAAGTLALAPEIFTRASRQPTEIAFADLRGVGRPQIVAAAASALLDGVTVLELADGGLSASATFTGSSAGGVDAADFNGDGRVDLVVSDGFSQTLTVLLNSAPLSLMDAGPFVVGPHAPIPPVPNNGGPVIQNVELYTLTYDGDPIQVERETYADWVVSSSWYTAVASEYGPGPGTNHNVRLTGTVPTTLADSDIGNLIAALIADGGLPPPVITDGGAPNQLYMIHFPEGTTITLPGFGPSCQSYCGYHADNGVFSYAVIPTCGGGCGALGLTVSHELVEASTDPFPERNPAYSAISAAQSGYIGEVADLCNFYSWTDGVHVATRSWSNKAAAAGTQPCVPAPDEPFAGIAPPNATIVVVPAGQSVSLELNGWSTVPAGPFAVGILPYSDSLAMSGFTPTADVDAGLLENGGVTSVTIGVPAGTAAHQLGIVTLFAGYTDDNLFSWPVVVESF